MLATAAMHRSRSIKDAELAYSLAMEGDSYHGQCVELLLPMLLDSTAVTDEAFLACSTILRFYEEISGRSSQIFHFPLQVLTCFSACAWERQRPTFAGRIRFRGRDPEHRDSAAIHPT